MAPGASREYQGCWLNEDLHHPQRLHGTGTSGDGENNTCISSANSWSARRYTDQYVSVRVKEIQLRMFPRKSFHAPDEKGMPLRGRITVFILMQSSGSTFGLPGVALCFVKDVDTFSTKGLDSLE